MMPAFFAFLDENIDLKNYPALGGSD